MINKLKVENASEIKMPAGKFLVVKLKERKHTVTRRIPVPSEEKDEAGEPIMEAKEVKQREPYFIQFYKIVSAPMGDDEYKVGDIVLAAFSAGAEFDLIPKAKAINKYDILGLYSPKM